LLAQLNGYPTFTGRPLNGPARPAVPSEPVQSRCELHTCRRKRAFLIGECERFGGLDRNDRKIETQRMRSAERTLDDLLAEIKDEVFEFLQTKAQMFVSEVHENLVYSKKAAIYGVLAFTLLGTGYLLLTLALVGLVAVAFWGSPYAWFFSFLIVGLSWSILGTMFAIAARVDFKGLAPRRAIKVLKEDKSVLATDAMNQS
jgi:uncharacterized membrane protein YqjE